MLEGNIYKTLEDLGVDKDFPNSTLVYKNNNNSNNNTTNN